MQGLPNVEDGRYGYHPSFRLATELAGSTRFDEVLLVGSDVPDLHDLAGEVRGRPGCEPALTSGLYWFAAYGISQLMVVSTPTHPGQVASVRAEVAEPDHPLAHARGWMETWWKDAALQQPARFRSGTEVVVLPGHEDGVVRRRSFQNGTWTYQVRVNGRTRQVVEGSLEPRPVDDDPWEWILTPAEPAAGLAATLTRAKLEGSLSDTVFSFRATRTKFLPYQFKPVLKFLQTGVLKLLVADEVGLGKTIEAGLLWTELEARGLAARTLVLVPSNLVAKWKLEMENRFGFLLQELDRDGLGKLAQRLREGRLSPRGAYVCSIERMRVWEDLQAVTDLRLSFDLVIVDEAHAFRNSGTKNNQLGELVSTWADHLVFLSATPLNLKREDLLNLLELLVPGEFEDIHSLEQRLEPNAPLNRISASFFDPAVDNDRRLDWLESIQNLRFAPAIVSRHEYAQLRGLLGQDDLTAADIARAKRLINELNALSAAVTRTRKVEVHDEKAVRVVRPVTVSWISVEHEFYEHYKAWCIERAKLANAPLGFCMQMPLRLVSSCMPAARDSVLTWELQVDDEEDEAGVSPDPVPASGKVPPSAELVAAAHALGSTDTKGDEFVPEIERLVEDGHRCLVFTYSKATLAHLAARLNGVARVAVLNGDVPKMKREKIMLGFRKDEYDVVLANRVASEGLDFEFCDVVINYDLPWNPMEIEQRIGRIDRIGQQSPTIHIVNFQTPGTIEADIVERVMDRIGVFQDTVGELEPIIQSNIRDLYRDALDFQLNDSERRRRTEERLAAIEERRLARADLETVAPMLISSDGMDIEGFEHDLVSRGRYIGQPELALLVRDWAGRFPNTKVTIATDARSLSLRGTAELAREVQELAVSRERSSAEVENVVSILRNEGTLKVSLDQEWSRQGGPDLLTSNHPLVRAALRVPGHRQVRYAAVRLESRAGVSSGRYLVHLCEATWTGYRAQKEIWTAVADLATGTSASDAIGDALLARLAEAALSDGEAAEVPRLQAALEVTSEDLVRRQVSELDKRQQDNRALLDARRISILEIHTRRRDSIERRRQTLLQDGNVRMARLAEAQLRRDESTERASMAALDAGADGDLQLEPLAVVALTVTA